VVEFLQIMETAQQQAPTSSASHHHASWMRTISITAIITVAVAYQLYQTAARTGNYEGMWFSLLHTLLVAVGAILALRPK
jgi:hypothetical protein